MGLDSSSPIFLYDVIPYPIMTLPIAFLCLTRPADELNYRLGRYPLWRESLSEFGLSKGGRLLKQWKYLVALLSNRRQSGIISTCICDKYQGLLLIIDPE